MYRINKLWNQIFVTGTIHAAMYLLENIFKILDFLYNFHMYIGHYLKDHIVYIGIKT